LVFRHGPELEGPLQVLLEGPGLKRTSTLTKRAAITEEERDLRRGLRREGEERAMEILVTHFEESEQRLIALAQAGLAALMLDIKELPLDLYQRMMAMWPS